MAALVLAIILISACGSPESSSGAGSKTLEAAPMRPVRAVPLSAGGPEPPTRFYLVLGGDVMLQEQIHEIARQRGQGDLARGYAWFLHALEPLLEDLRSRGEVGFVVNLESPVATERKEPLSFPPRFNGPPEALEGLALAGVDGVTVANNHALDQGRSGLVETLENARRAGLLAAGGGTDRARARAPMILGTSVRVELLAYYLRPRHKGEPSKGPVIAILDQSSLDEVRAARDRADAVVVTVHWVGEFAQSPRDELVAWAESLVRAGADAVVCHGPHVLGPAGIVETPAGRQALVAYSLGNLLSNMGWEVYPAAALEPGKDSAQRVEARQEALAVLEFTKPSETVLTGVSLVPVWLMDNRYAAYRKGGGPRLIYPLPLPNCRLPDPVPCFPASRPGECEALATTLEQLVERPTFSPFCPP
jgi:poly-gamma-glutamate synthesis protein (capsule biosynthesis protein)